MKRVPKTRIWASLTAALLLHALVLLLPVSRLELPTNNHPGYVEVEFSAFLHDPLESTEAVAETSPPPDVPVAPETTPLPVETQIPQALDVTPSLSEPEAPRVAERMPVISPRQEQQVHTDVILSRQFISQEAVIDRIFDKPVYGQPTIPHAEFQFPARQNLLTMLDKPMQDLPFEYTPGLVHFAYAPGVRGDLQRFWDVITPEFGWRTDNGTEFRCVWALIIVGCGWK